MKLNRSYNTKRNIIVGEIDKISGVILPFIVRTMIIHLIGAEYLGLTGLFYSIIQMLNLVEMGFGTAIIYSMYKPIADNDTKKINALLKFYGVIYRRVGIAVTIIGLMLMPFLRYFISGEIPEDTNIYILYLIYLLNPAIGFFVFPNRKAILTAHQRDDIGGKIHIWTQLTMYIVQAIGVWLTKDYYLYALTLPLSSLVYSILCARKSKQKYPDYYSEGELDKETYADIKHQVYGLMIRKVATLSRNAFDSIFVSAYLGLTMNTIYSNYYYIMDSVVVIIAVVKTSMAGGVGNSIAMESKQKNLADMNKINFLFMWIGGFCSICMLCLYQPFMRLWVGEDMTLSFGIALLFSIYFYILKMADIRILYSESAGIWWQQRYLSVLEAIFNLVLNWTLIQFMGLEGIIIATLISYFVFNFIGGAVILFRHYFTEGGIAGYFLSHFRYMLITVFVGAVTYYVTSLISTTLILELIFKGMICMVLPNILYILIYFKTKDFKNGIGLITGILKKRK